ncbi:MAG: hypothetical protein HY553_16370 [Elusimicrobia bacterium]|nr:hypothetical protein [Elusimicrobiota bacterium]
MSGLWEKAGWAAVLVLAAGNVAAEPFRTMAKELSRAAERAGIARVAVVPFTSAEAAGEREGWTIAEKLTTQLVRVGRVRTIERSLLGKVMEELKLGRTGLLRSSGLKRAGEVLAVDAIVTGTFVPLGNQATVAARLIEVETGAIIAAVERRADREWHDPLGLSGKLAAMPLDPYAFGGPDGEPPLLPPAVPLSPAELFPPEDARDSLSGDRCRDAAERVDRMEASILDLKARYWASELKAGLKVASLKFNPGSTITDPLLKRRFYEQMKDWYARPSIPPMNPHEVKRFTEIDSMAFSLYRECGL